MVSRRTVPILVPLLMVLVCATATAEPGPPRSSVRAETAVQLTASWFGFYVAAEPHVIWRPSWFGAGAGVKVAAGGSQFDLHVAPFTRAELWWFYLNAGWAVELVDLTSRYQPIDDGIFIAAGIAPDLVPAGDGRFGADLGFEMYLKATGNDGHEAPAGDLVRSWGVPEEDAGVLEYIVGTSLLRVSILYTFPL